MVTRHAAIQLFLLVLIGSLSYSEPAQKVDAFARVSISPREGVVRQPYKVTISVYSSTWFASPLQFTNLQIENAFIIPFTRTVSGIDYINKKKYASLTFYYLVFPYSTGTLEIPELVINADIPPEGEYKGKPVTIRTRQQAIRVNPIPKTNDTPIELVASNVSIQEKWSRSFDDLQVGDVLERTITIRANNTIPSLIPPLHLKEPEQVSVYPSDAELQDKRTANSANGVRIEHYSYLFEQEGTVLIPELKIQWWNPLAKKPYERSLKAQNIVVTANPDLAMLTSLKDSLQAMAAPQAVEPDAQQWPWWKLGLLVLVTLLLLYRLIRFLRSWLQNLRKRKQDYRQSEAYYFKQVGKAIQKANSAETLQALYSWFDRARDGHQSAAMANYLSPAHHKILQQLVEQASGKNQPLSPAQKRELSQLAQALRKQLLGQGATPEKSLNPC